MIKNYLNRNALHGVRHSANVGARGRTSATLSLYRDRSEDQTGTYINPGTDGDVYRLQNNNYRAQLIYC